MNTDPTGGDHPTRLLAVSNRQRACRIDGVHLRRLVRFHLEEQLKLRHYDLAVHLLSSRRMAEVNVTHLQHQGPTDVITFDYGEPGTDGLHGELLVCPAVAIEQAREFGTTWESEILRYIVHGVLHLRGYDDQTAAERRRMKRAENRLLQEMVGSQPVGRLRARPGTSPKPSLE